MEHGERILLANQLGVQIQKSIQPPLCFLLIDGFGHQEVCGVMVAFGLDQAAVECGKVRVNCLQCRGQDAKLLAASALDERATDEVIDDLVALAVADSAHQAGNPRAGIRLAECDPATLKQIENELKVL